MTTHRNIDSVDCRNDNGKLFCTIATTTREIEYPVTNLELGPSKVTAAEISGNTLLDLYFHPKKCKYDSTTQKLACGIQPELIDETDAEEAYLEQALEQWRIKKWGE